MDLSAIFLDLSGMNLSIVDRHWNLLHRYPLAFLALRLHNFNATTATRRSSGKTAFVPFCSWNYS